MEMTDTLKYMANAAEWYENLHGNFANVDNIDDVRNVANKIMGFIDGVAVFIKTMVEETENVNMGNTFAAMITEWQAEVLDVVLEKAVAMEADKEFIHNINEDRDFLRKQAHERLEDAYKNRWGERDDS